MSWWAFDKIQDAADDTRDLLLPFELGTWARIAVLVIFTGSGLGSPNIPSGGYGGEDVQGLDSGFSQTELSNNPELNQVLNDPLSSAPSAAFSSMRSGLVLGIVGVVGLFLLLFLLLSSVFQFVYYQSLVDENVRLRENFRKHFRNGINYALLSLLFFVIMIAMVAGSFTAMFANPVAGVLGLFGTVILLVPAAIAMGLVNNIVLPETIYSGRSFWSSLKTGFSKIRDEWKQTGVYILTRFGLKMITGIVTAIYAVITLLLGLILFGIIAVVAYMVEPLLAVIPASIGLIAWFIALVGAQVVVSTYLNYYALNFYKEL